MFTVKVSIKWIGFYLLGSYYLTHFKTVKTWFPFLKYNLALKETV